MWVLPVPLGPSAMTFSRRSTHSQRASSSTCILFRAGIALKSKLSRCPAAYARIRERGLLTAGNLAALIPLPGRVLRSNSPRGGARSCGAPASGRTPANHDPAAYAAGHLQFDQARQELHMVQSFCRSLLGKLAIFPQNGWQSQGLEAMVQQDLGGFGHAARPRIRASTTMFTNVILDRRVAALEAVLVP